MWRNAMGRRSASCIIAAVVLTAPLLATAQMSTKAYRIGWLGHGSGSAANPSVADFRQGLRDLRYIEGQNLAFEFINVRDDRAERFDAAMQELIRRKVDIIVGIGPEAHVKSAMNATSSLPIIIIATNFDPVDKHGSTALHR